jgi:hypothetical protein
MGVMVGGDENEASVSDPVGKGSEIVEVHSNVGEVAEFNEETDGAAADEKVEIDDVLIVSDETNGIKADDIDDIDADDIDGIDADDIDGIDADETDVDAASDAGVEADGLDDGPETDEADGDVLVDETVGTIIDEAVDIAAEIDERSRYIAAAGCKNVRKRTMGMVQKTGGAAGKTGEYSQYLYAMLDSKVHARRAVSRRLRRVNPQGFSGTQHAERR